MFARALIVLLLVLNIGIAVWWSTRSEAMTMATSADAVTDAHAARLRLLSELSPAERKALIAVPPSPAVVGAVDATAAATDAAANPSTATPAASDVAPNIAAATPPAQHCYAFGPFADAVQVAAARAGLRATVARMSERQVVTSARGWRVWLPPLADRDAAQAAASRLGAAGMDDFVIVSTGAEANSVSLGRYGSESAANRRVATLRDAGFPDVVAAPLDQSPPQLWLDVAAEAPLAMAASRRLAGAAQSKDIACDSVR